MLFEAEARILVGATHYPTVVEPVKANQEAQEIRAKALLKLRVSDKFRLWGICSMWISLIVFLAGCYFGAEAVILG
jgi:hypothetical protein